MTLWKRSCVQSLLPARGFTTPPSECLKLPSLEKVHHTYTPFPTGDGIHTVSLYSASCRVQAQLRGFLSTASTAPQSRQDTKVNSKSVLLVGKLDDNLTECVKVGIIGRKNVLDVSMCERGEEGGREKSVSQVKA